MHAAISGNYVAIGSLALRDGLPRNIRRRVMQYFWVRSSLRRAIDTDGGSRREAESEPCAQETLHLPRLFPAIWSPAQATGLYEVG